MDSEFTCVACGDTFIKGWTDEESKAEAEAVFTKEELTDPNPVTVCDVCWLAWRADDPEFDLRYKGVSDGTT